MRKGRDRDQRRSRFDDDQPDASYEAPRQMFRAASRVDAAPEGPAVEAVVRWFNPDKGFGFVEFGNDDEARNAISALYGQEYGGRALTVNEARPKTQSGGGGGRRDRRRCAGQGSGLRW